MSNKFQKKLDKKKATRIEGLSSTSLDFRSLQIPDTCIIVQ
jgi:hypothetical protein